MRFLRRIAIVLGIVLIPLWIGAWLVVAQPMLPRGPVSSVSVDTEALKRHVRALSETYAPRDYLHFENLNRSADYIREEFGKTEANRVEEQYYTAGGKRYRNVVARFGSGEDGLLVIGAHYDACGRTPGADDNASGVAGLIELARLLGKYPIGRSVELVAYTLEEPPFFRTQWMGSAVHAQDLYKRGAKVRGVVVLEMIGYFNDGWMSQDFPSPALRLLYPSRGNFIAVTGKMDQRKFVRDLKGRMNGATSLPVYSINAPASLPGIDFSDHLNYWPYGYEAVMVTDTAFYRNREYHEVGDTWNRLDYLRMGQVVAGIYEAIKDLP